MAITLRERYTQTTQSFPGLQQARAALKSWLQTNHVEVHDAFDASAGAAGWAQLWEIGGHSPILGVDYQYRIELPGPVNTGIPVPQQ